MMKRYHKRACPATVSFKTVGCRLNQAETAAIRAAFEASGFSVVPFGRSCDVCVVHGCTVTAKAEKDSLRLARTARRLNPDALVILSGCVAEIGGDAAREACGADLLAGQSDKFNMPEIVIRHGVCPTNCAGETTKNSVSKGHPLLPRFDTTRAIVKIQDGCDFFCAYCIVPYARGRTKSRPVEEIIGEIKALGEAGYKEVVLTGANIGCYDDAGRKLIHLLKQVEKLPVIDRVRISSIEVSTIERDVIDFMSESEKLCRFLHLPLQSGDDRVLQKMRRRYTVAQYRDVVEYALNKLGVVGLGTDVLAGFPGEDGGAFDATKKLIEVLPFNNLHVFSYSNRPGTAASRMAGEAPPLVIKERVARLKETGLLKRMEFARSMIGVKQSVLIEKIDDKGHAFGWTKEYLEANVSGPGLSVNSIISFIPDRISGKTLCGQADYMSMMGPFPGGGPR